MARRKGGIIFDAREFQSKLRQIPEELRRATQEGLNEGASLIADKAEANAPRDDGDLQAGIGWEEVQSDRPEAAAFSRAPHSHLIELGTVERHHKTGKATGRVTANPFFSSAVKSTQRKVRGLLIEKNKRTRRALSRRRRR